MNKSNDIKMTRFLELSLWAINHHLRRNTSGYAASFIIYLKDELAKRDQVDYQLICITDGVTGLFKTQIIEA